MKSYPKSQSDININRTRRFSIFDIEDLDVLTDKLNFKDLVVELIYDSPHSGKSI